MNAKEKYQIDSWGYILQAQSSIVQEADRQLKEAGMIPLVWYDIILIINKSKDRKLRLNEIVKRMVLTKSGISRTVDRMMEEGYLKKEKCKEDGRGIYIIYTQKGYSEFRKAWAIYSKVIKQMLVDKLTDDEIENLRSSLGKIFTSNC